MHVRAGGVGEARAVRVVVGFAPGGANDINEAINWQAEFSG